MNNRLSVKLYKRDYTTLVEDLTSRVRNLTFSTRLPGGFYTCSFTLDFDEHERWDWAETRLGYRLVIEDLESTLTTRFVWEGRIEDVGMMSLANLWNSCYAVYESAGAIARCTTVTDATSIAKYGLTRNYCVPNLGASGVTVADNAAAAWLADHKYIYPSLANLRNRDQVVAYGYYSSLGDNTYTTAYNDSTSTLVPTVLTAKCPLISSTTHVTSGGTTINSAAGAEWLDLTVMDLFAKWAGISDASGNKWYFAVWDSREPWWFVRSVATVDWEVTLAELQNMSLTLGPRVRDANGRVWPSWRIRAGDVLRIVDLVPSTAQISAVTRDRVRTFFVTETRYSVERASMAITVEADNPSLTAMLARSL